jgi:hypothetical protein
VTSDQRYRYARAVWSALKEHSVGSPRLTLDLMTPAEWWLLATWMDRDIPFRIVLRAFEDCKGKGRTLLYWAGPVEQAYKHWLEAVS